jgi:hypothetical protein
MAYRALLRASITVAALSSLASVASAQRIQMPVGFRLTWIGARWQPDAKVVDQSGRPVAAALSYRIADPSVASVSSRGEVIARKPGNTRLWAVAGRDSASALIVVEQWPAKFTFSPSVVRFDAVGSRQPIAVLASDSAGVPIVGGSSRSGSCRSVNGRVASLAGDTVVSVANGTTWIRCSDRGGIADSIRVDVAQRPIVAMITNKPVLTRQRAAGDTFSVRVSARDRMQKEVADARFTWASLNPLVVSVDAITGRARAVGGGEARVIVQVGDVADSVLINVSGPAMQPLVAAAPVVDSTPKSRASLIVQEHFLYEGDTSYIQVNAYDSAGAQVGFAQLSYRLLDTAVAGRLDTARIIGRKSGQTKLLIRYAGLVDSAMVNVRPRPVGGSEGGAAAAAARAAFRAPEIPDSSAQQTRIRQDVDRIIHTDPNVGSRQQNLVLLTNAFGSVVEQLARTEAGVAEDRTGPVYGGAGSLILLQKLELAGTLRIGTLTSVDTTGETLAFKELEASAGLFPVRQLGIRAGMILRGEKSELATQTWMIPKVSLVNRATFIGDVFNTFLSFSVMPKALSRRSNGDDERGSLFSRGGEAGIEFRLPGSKGLNGGITYFVEQLSFDETTRVESLSAIRLRFGFNIGR